MLSCLHKKFTANKTKHFLTDNDLSYYRGKQYFDEESGKQKLFSIFTNGKIF